MSKRQSADGDTIDEGTSDTSTEDYGSEGGFGGGDVPVGMEDTENDL